MTEWAFFAAIVGGAVALAFSAGWEVRRLSRYALTRRQPWYGATVLAFVVTALAVLTLGGATAVTWVGAHPRTWADPLLYVPAEVAIYAAGLSFITARVARVLAHRRWHREQAPTRGPS